MGLDHTDGTLRVFALVLAGEVRSKSVTVENHPRGKRRVWVLLLLFMVICATAASTDELAGIHTIWGLFGSGIWVFVAIVISILASRRAKRA